MLLNACKAAIDLSCNSITVYPTHKDGVDLLTDKDVKAIAKDSAVMQFFASLDKKPRMKMDKSKPIHKKAKK